MTPELDSDSRFEFKDFGNGYPELCFKDKSGIYWRLKKAVSKTDKHSGSIFDDFEPVDKFQQWIHEVLQNADSGVE